MSRKLLCLFLLLSTGLIVLHGQESGLPVSRTSAVVTENFDAMWDATSSSATLSLPSGWRVDRNLTAARTVGSYESAAAEVMYAGGENLASNAKNGTWNWGSSSDNSDRAVGGLSTTVSGGTRCVSLMAHLTNSDTEDIERLTFSYDIEKYRKGSNSAGFVVQMYYSTDGSTWTSAGDDFATSFSPDNETLGAATVPIETVNVSGKNLKISVAAGADIYLAWNISVASGSSPNLAMGLALDNVQIEATYAGETNNSTIYVEDVSGWSALNMVVDNTTTLEPQGSASVNGVAYKYFELPADGLQHSLLFTNGGSKQVGPFSITASRDYYLCLTADEATEIDDPESYTGWVDPTRPPFKASGIYLRGEVTSWNAVSDWEFSDEGDGVYVLYDKTLNGNFKVADASWSSACNYGSNGSAILMDTPYQLVSGTNDNISCGSNTFATSRIVLTISGGTATLLLESNNDDTDLTEVYVIGDNNGWNYMDASGKLSLTSTEGVFEGQITLPAADGEEVGHWRIYQKLGMGGVWGAPGGTEATGDNRNGTLEKGSTASMTTTPGTYKVTFNITNGEFDMEQLGSVPTAMELLPQFSLLVPTLPEQVKVLSLNNSLIYYHDQDEVFNSIASAMGKNAKWTKHTLLGKSLNAHWSEGDGVAEDGNPGAKMLVRSDAWSHIILQEQSSLPRTDPETFRNNVKKWVDYIRDYCPNPNAVIIVPVNWAYSGDWSNYTEFNRTFLKNYEAVARELGITLCPVGCAYQNVYDAEGSTETLTWFEDDRHPTLKATYMAACMEYSLIFGEDAATISYAPEGLTSDVAAKMRSYASQAMNGHTNTVEHTASTVRLLALVTDQFGLEIAPEEPVSYSIDGGGTIDGNGVFVSNGTLGDYTVTATTGEFTKQATVRVAAPLTEVVTYPAIELNEDKLSATENFDAMGSDAEASLPEAWRIDHPTDAPRTLGRFDQAQQNTMYSGGVSLPSNAKNGTWNFGSTAGDDRAPGGISTGVAGGTRCVNVYAHLLNTGKKNIENVTVSYDVEKYRKGSNGAGFDVQLYYSIDGRNWTSAGSDFLTHFAPDSETAGYADVPGETVAVSATLPTNIARGCDLYLAWNISVASGTAAASAMALAIDNFSIAGELPSIPAAKHYVYAEDKTGWNALGLYAWGDSELYGSWPGQAVVGEVVINDITYQVFPLDTEGGNFNLIFNNWNNGQQLPDVGITANRDYYFTLSDTKATEVDPNTYSGISQPIAESNDLVVQGTVVSCEGQIEAYDLSGRRIASASGTLDLANLQKGIYIIRAAKARQAIKVRR